jgi:hypothetical protein
MVGWAASSCHGTVTRFVVICCYRLVIFSLYVVSGSSSESTMECRACLHTRARMKECGQCRGVFYCSRRCQKNHWRKHRQECEGFKVHVNQLGGETIDIKRCRYAETVKELKKRIAAQVDKRKNSWRLWKFNLVYGLRCLKPTETLANVGVRRDADIQLVTTWRKLPRLTEESDSMPDLASSSSEESDWGSAWMGKCVDDNRRQIGGPLLGRLGVGALPLP